MPLFVTTGCYTATSAKGMIDNPSDREQAARSIMEAAGGRLHSFYLTTGETDWMAITEFDDGANLIPALLVVSASGAVSNVKTVRAYTGAEFQAAQEKASKIASSYRPPAK